MEGFIETKFNENKGYPAGNNFYYQCGLCGDIIQSIPADSNRCKCRNLSIDTDAGRISVEKIGSVKLLKRIPSDSKGSPK